MLKIKIGPSGTTGLSYEEAFSYLKANGLTALEVPFTYGVRMKSDQAKDIGYLANKYGIGLSVHGPYYINLASLESDKVEASKQRILHSCEIANEFSTVNSDQADIQPDKINIIFHPGFYMGRDPKIVYDLIRKEISELIQIIDEKQYNVRLCPETTGKPSQFGSLEELSRLIKDTDCGICIDFAHLWARNQGQKNFDTIMQNVANLKLEKIHSHFSGIEYGPKGEKKHIPFSPDYLNEFVNSISLLSEKTKQITIICESPEPLEDAMFLKNTIVST